MSHNTDLERYVVLRQLVQHVIGQSVHDGFTRLPTATARVFGLDADNGRQHRVGCVGLVPAQSTPTRSGTSQVPNDS